MLDEATACDIAFRGSYNSTTSRKAETGVCSVNESEVTVARRINFDVCHLLHEQHEFLAHAQPNEIRALLFLRLRLSAQQKRKAQCNQLAERRALQNTRSSAASLLAAGQSFDAVNLNVIEEATPRQQLKCQGCLRRYSDIVAFSRHQDSCRKYAAFIRGSGAHCTDGAAGAPHLTDATTTRGVSCRGGQGNGTNTHPVMSLRTESQSTNYSLSIPVSPPQEERLGKVDNGGSPLCGSVSRDFSPPPFSPAWQQNVSAAPKYSMDDVPASVEVRLLREKEASLPIWAHSSFASKPKEDVESSAAVNMQTLSNSHSNIRLESNSLSPVNVAFETSCVDEPLKPCPHCGRRFFAESRWPRHVAVCEQQKQQARQIRTSGSRHNLDSSMRRATSFTANSVPKSVGTLCSVPQSLSPENSFSRSGAAADKKDIKRSKQPTQPAGSLLRGSTSSQQRASVSGGGRNSTNAAYRVYCSICGRSFSSAAAEQHMQMCKKRAGSGRRGIV